MTMVDHHWRKTTTLRITTLTVTLLLIALLSPSSPSSFCLSRGSGIVLTRADEPVASEDVEGDDFDGVDTQDGFQDEGDDGDAEGDGEEGDDEELDEDDDAASTIEDQFHMSREELESRMKSIFPFLDTDNNQKLSKEEVMNWLKKIHEKVEIRQGKMEFDGVDTDHDEFLSLEELNKAYFGEDEAAAKEGAQDIQARFNTVDKDKDGKLSPSEFNRLLRVSEEPELLELEVNEILKSQDTDKDGKISLGEFKGPDGTSGEDSGEGNAATLATEFEQYDKDKSGFIEPKEVEAIIVEHSGVNHQIDLEDVFRDAELTPEDGDEISMEKFIKNAENIASSKITDFGEILRFPSEYKLDLPFKEIEEDESDDDGGRGKEEL